MPRVKDRVRQCQQCQSDFELGEKMGQYKYCSVLCRKAWHASKFKTSERSKKDPRKQKEYWLKNKYGISIGIFEGMLERQNNSCEVCLKGIGWSAHVDHCHDTAVVRALLCSQCNQALGLLKEDVNVMDRMISYVKQHKC